MVSAELAAMIRSFERQPPLVGATAEELRASLAGADAARPVPDGTAVEQVDAGGVPAEWVRAPVAGAGTIVYLHGGGYCIGSIGSHRHLVCHLSAAAGTRCLAVDYRLAPEHPFPAALDDTLAAYGWLVHAGVAPTSIVLAGDSAGGGLVVAALVALRDAGEPLPAGGVCLSPWVDLTCGGDTIRTKAEVDPLVSRAGLEQMARDYLAGADPRTPLASPLFAELRGLPPLLVQVGTREVLLADATRLAERARAAGVAVTFEPWEGAVHCWHTFVPDVPEARAAVTRVGAWVRERLADAAAG